jgi:hypothetical protein
MKFRLLLICFLISAPSPALAVIAAKIPLSKTFTTSSPVIVAKITNLNPSNRAIEVDITETVVGAAPEKIRLHLIQPQSLFSQLKEGDPVILFVGKGRGSQTATIHLGDTWLSGQLKPDSNPPIWQIIKEESNDFRKAYPGTTDTLILILHEYKENKNTFLSAADERLFTGGIEQLAQLTLTPNGLFTADLNNDKSPELLISTPHGPQILAAVEGGYDFVTKKYSPPDSGTLLAVGDLNGDNKPDLVIDKIPYLNHGTTFKPEKALDIPSRPDLLVISIVDGKLITLSKNGELRVGSEMKNLWIEKDSPPRLAAAIGSFGDVNDTCVIVLTDSTLTRYSMNGQSADFTRLTGEPLSTYLKDSDGKFKSPKLVPIDANHDKRMDLLVLSEKSNFLLINRGFGAYFVSPAAAGLALNAGPDMPHPFASAATSSHWAALNNDLLVLTPDGAFYRLVNPPHAPPK